MLALAPFLLLPMSCAAPPGRDLTRNENLYHLTGYRSLAKPKLTAHIAPLEDGRTAPPETVEGFYRPSYTMDGHWSAPVPNMVQYLLVEEIGNSGIFSELLDEPDAADVVIEPTLLAFHGSVEERMIGRMLRGLTRIRLDVKGAKGPGGVRPLIFSETYQGGELTSDGLGFGPDPFAFAGQSLQISMAIMLKDLDRRKIGREVIAAEAAGSRPESGPAGVRN
jgi:hypothetical protein